MKSDHSNQNKASKGEDSLLNLVLDALVGGVVVLDADKRVVVWNDWMQQASGIEQDSSCGHALFELFPELSQSRIEKAVDDCLIRGSASLLSHALMTVGFPLHANTSEGQPIKQVVYVKPVAGQDGRRNCVIQINDVTAAVRREQQLRIATREALTAQHAAEELAGLKSAFISVVSHELRTPLTSIRGSLSLVTNGVIGEIPKKVSDLLNVADRNAERLLALINDILDVEKYESGKMHFEFSRISVKALLDQAIEGNNGFAQTHKVEFKLGAVDGGIFVNVDDNRMLQVMTNLMSNAAKYEPKGGTVELSARVHEDSVRISIVDHGPGIPEKFKSRMFEKFSQAETGDTRKVGGTGLGLVISKAIVESHKGTLGFESVPHERTEFYVDLPCVP